MSIGNPQRVLMALAVVVGSWLPSLAQNFDIDYLKYHILSTKEKTVEVDCLVDENIENIVIPSEVYYDGVNYTVAAIGYNAFDFCHNLKSVDIPDSVKSICDCAFYNCSALMSVKIGTSVKSIGRHAFSYCSSLTSINIPNSTETIEYGAFLGCESLEAVTIGKSVISFGEFAFAGNNSLAGITVSKDNPNYDSRGGCNAIIETATNTLMVGCSATAIPRDVKHIGENAFFNCMSLRSFDIPDWVETIGRGAFSECQSLESITIGKSVNSIEENVVDFCHNLTSITVSEDNPNYDSRGGCNAIIETATNTLVIGCSATVIPQDVKHIGEYAFHGCTSLQSIDIPVSVETIGGRAFMSCMSLTTIVLGNSIRSIGDRAFCCCAALKSVEIGESVELIGDAAFLYCLELKKVYSRATTPPVCPSAEVFDNQNTHLTIYVPIGCLDIYIRTVPWNDFDIREWNPLDIDGVAADEVAVKVVGGSIIFSSKTDAKVYTSAGMLVASGVIGEVEVPAGIYIVRVGDKTAKVIVR